MSNTQPTPPSTPQPPYSPGDIVNGHRLSTEGRWEPLIREPMYPDPGRNLPKPKKSHTTRNVLVTLGVVVFLLFAGCTALVAVVGSVEENTGTSDPGSVSQGLGANDATGDVVFSGAAAAPDAIGITYLPVTVTNHSEKRSDYSIEIAADAADGSRVDFTYVMVMSLDPGQTTTEQAMFTEDLPAGTAFHVIQVQRTASL